MSILPENLTRFEPDDVEKARQEVYELSQSSGTMWHMRIPPHRDDSDQLLLRVIERAAQAEAEDQRTLETAMEDERRGYSEQCQWYNEERDRHLERIRTLEAENEQLRAQLAAACGDGES